MSSLSASLTSSDADENQAPASVNLLEDVQILKPGLKPDADVTDFTIPSVMTPRTPKKRIPNLSSTPKTPGQLLAGTPFASPAHSNTLITPISANISSSPHDSTASGSTSWSTAGFEKDDTILITREDFARVVELKHQFDKSQDELTAANNRICELENDLKACKREYETKLREVFEDHLRSQEQVRKLSMDIQKQIERQSELQQRYDALESDQQLLIRERDLVIAENAGQAEELLQLRAHAERLAVRLEEMGRLRLEQDDMSDNATDDDDVAADAEDPNSEPNAWESKEALDPNHSLDGEMSSSRRSKRGRRSKSQVYMKQIAELQARLKQAQTELIQERNMNELYCQTISSQRLDLEKLTATLSELQRLDERLNEVTELSQQQRASSIDAANDDGPSSGSAGLGPQVASEVMKSWSSDVGQASLQAELISTRSALAAEKAKLVRFSTFVFTLSTAAIILVLIALIYL